MVFTLNILHGRGPNNKMCHQLQLKQTTALAVNTVYGKTFGWENFHGFHSFQPITKVFPLNHFLCTVHDGHGLMHHESFPVNSVFYARPRKFPHSKVFAVYSIAAKGVLCMVHY